MFTAWHGLFSLVLMFSGLRIEAPPLSTVQSKYIYTFFKAENQEIQFLSYVLNLNKFSFFEWSIVPGLIYRPSMPNS